PEFIPKKRKITPVNPLETFKKNQDIYVGENNQKNGSFTTASENSVFSGVEEDDERFFGGGLTKTQEDILDLMDENDKNDFVGPEIVDASLLKKLVLKLERGITKNQELRIKNRFLLSEADLDSDIKALSVFSSYPELYPEMIRLRCFDSLISLLSHENADIAIAVLELFDELIDDDIDYDQNQMKSLINTLLIGIFENISSFSPIFSENAVSSTNILDWLLKRLQIKEFPISQNKQYVAELLAIYISSSSFIRKKFINLNGVDILLHVLSPYRKRDPVKDIEEEFVENIFDCLCSLLQEQEGKEKFVEAEGIELCLIMLRDGKFCKYRSLKVLDHALCGLHGITCCERLVEAAGLRSIFSIFMKKVSFKAIEYLLGIFSSLLRSLPIDSASRIRILAKFVEKDYEKISRIIELRRFYEARVDSTNEKIKKELERLNQNEREEKESEIYIDLLDSGLYCLQAIDLILAWLCVEDLGVKKKVLELLKTYGKDISSIKTVLQ
ncbi:unnamed protein product, partial [Pneumocystis jirovecii]